MQRFRRLFALLFILSVLVGIFHEINHDHHGETCEVCVLSHAPAVVSDVPPLTQIDKIRDSFESPFVIEPTVPSVLSRSRSPPLT